MAVVAIGVYWSGSPSSWVGAGPLGTNYALANIRQATIKPMDEPQS